MMIVTPPVGVAQSCAGPNAQQQANVAVYVSKKFHAASVGDLSLVTNEKANDACFWRYVYEDGRKTRITVYLSPDRTFLAPDLFDLRVDPLLEERKHAEAILNAMLAGDPPLMGPMSAPVSLVEFSDFECPYCQRLKDMLEKEVLPKSGGKVKIIFRNFPLSMHPWAKRAAMMASCADLQDPADFWRVHDFLFDNQKILSPDNLAEKVSEFVSTGTKLNKSQFQQCVDKDLALGIVTKDIALGQDNGVHATPTAFINGVRYEGMQNAAQLLAIIESAAHGDFASLPASESTAAVNAGNQCGKPPANSQSKTTPDR
jgi:protein-disulfide isomerase